MIVVQYGFCHFRQTRKLFADVTEPYFTHFMLMSVHQLITGFNVLVFCDFTLSLQPGKLLQLGGILLSLQPVGVMGSPRIPP